MCTACVGAHTQDINGLASLDDLGNLYTGTPWVTSEVAAGPDGVMPLGIPEQTLPASFIDGLTPAGPRTMPRPGAISKTPSGWVLGYNSACTQEQSDAYETFNEARRNPYATSLNDLGHYVGSEGDAMFV